MHDGPEPRAYSHIPACLYSEGTVRPQSRPSQPAAGTATVPLAFGPFVCMIRERAAHINHGLHTVVPASMPAQTAGAYCPRADNHKPALLVKVQNKTAILHSRGPLPPAIPFVGIAHHSTQHTARSMLPSGTATAGVNCTNELQPPPLARCGHVTACGAAWPTDARCSCIAALAPHHPALGSGANPAGISTGTAAQQDTCRAGLARSRLEAP